MALKLLSWRNTPSLTVNSLAFTPSTAFDSLSVHKPIQFPPHHTRGQRLTQKAGQREGKRKPETNSWPAATLYHLPTEAFEKSLPCVCLCLCVCGERLQAKAEGKKFWFICPDLVIATFKGTAGNGDGWRLLGLHFFPSLNLQMGYLWRPPGRQYNQQPHTTSQKPSLIMWSQQIKWKKRAWYKYEYLFCCNFGKKYKLGKRVKKSYCTGIFAEKCSYLLSLYGWDFIIHMMSGSDKNTRKYRTLNSQIHWLDSLYGTVNMF